MSTNSLWISRPKPRPDASLRLFCFPHAGAGAVIFRDWYAAFPPHIEVCSFELPGHFVRRREPLIRDMQELVRAMESDVEPLLDRPFAFFGYSLGALVSFSLAQSLRRRSGLQPVQLLVAAAKAPQAPRTLPPITHEPRAVFLREVERRYGPFDPLIKQEQDLFDLVLEITQADMAILESYKHLNESPFDCPLIAIGGKEDRSIDVETLEAWSAHTRASFQAHWLPGGHFFLKTAGPALLGLVRDALGGPV